MSLTGYICLVLCAYILGSIPTGYLAAKARGIDIRTVGSGNIGATNAFRVLGKPAGTLVLFVDALKGYLACTLLTNLLLRAFGHETEPFSLAMTERVVAGIVAVLGHNFTFWLRFKGGKGISTTAGVYLAVAPLSIGIAIALWFVVLFVTRYVSLASILAAVALPTAVWITQSSIPLGIATTAVGAMAIWKHKSNIIRLAAGTENRVRFGRNPTEGTQA